MPTWQSDLTSSSLQTPDKLLTDSLLNEIAVRIFYVDLGQLLDDLPK